MIIGVPKEIKSSEYRVALTPAGAGMLRASGHEVLVQQGLVRGAGLRMSNMWRKAPELLKGQTRYGQGQR